MQMWNSFKKIEKWGTVRESLAPRPAHVFAFGPFRLDPQREVLTYGSESVPLAQRLFDLLRALVEANGSLVSRETLNGLIWPDGCSDNNLSQHVYMLRKALGERAGDRLYITTVHNKGFRFVAPVSVEQRSEPEMEPPENQPPDRQLLRPGLDVFGRYSRGLQSFELGTAASLQRAIEHFEAVLRIDPEYTPALVDSARSRLALVQACYIPADEQCAKARSAVVRTLQLNPSCAVGHAVLSNIDLLFDWNWRDARRELDHAITLNPENTIVRTSAMWLYLWIGQPARAVIEAQRAVMAQPSSAPLQMLLGRALIGSGDYNRALDHFSSLIEVHPEYATQSHCQRALALILNNQSDRALLDLRFLPEDRAEDLAWRLPLLGQAYAGDGQEDKAQQIYETLCNAAKTEYVAQTNLVALALSVGRTEMALEHFKAALAQREPALPLMRHSPRLDSIRKSDAFKSLVDAMGW